MRKIICILLSAIMVFSLICGVNAYALSGATRGDCNDDRKVNTKDILLMKKYMANNSVTIDNAQADCDGDGVVTTADKLILAKYLANISEDFAADPENVKDGWNYLMDFEDGTIGSSPTELASYPMIDVKVASSSDEAKNNLNDNSTKTLAFDALKTKNTLASICNPEAQGEPTSLNVNFKKTRQATNMRASIKIPKNENEAKVVYIGYQIGYEVYYNRLDIASYENFCYYYFVGKTYKHYDGIFRTYQGDDPEETVLTKEDVPSIDKICFWYENSAQSTLMYVDDVEFFVGKNGFDSTDYDNSLPKTQTVNDGKKKYICISFDDGAQGYLGKDYMEYYLDEADKYNANFTFFLWGNYLDTGDVPSLKRAINSGSELGNHTWEHLHMPSLTAASQIEQITKIDDWLQEKVGVKTKLLRPPFLDVSDSMYKNIDTTCIGGWCPEDYSYTSVDYRVEYFKRFTSDGSILLIHEPYISNVEVVKRLLKYYSDAGYEFVTISDLFEIRGITPSHNTLYREIV